MTASEPDRIVLMLAGDVMTGRGIDQILAHPGAPALHEPHVRDARDYVRLAEAVNGPVPAPVAADYVWGDALAQIDHVAPDLRIVNLETAVTTSDRAWPDKAVHYRMHPANIGCLTAARIDACTLANNHVLDWGRAGLDETLRSLRQAGVRTAGAGADGAAARAAAVLSLGARGRVLLVSRATRGSGVPSDWAARPGCAGVALLDDLSQASARQIAQDAAGVRRPGDCVVVSIHWGGNWGLDVRASHRVFARQLIDLGAADVVHGHSSHHPMPLEVYRGRLILYGCGDLINDYEGIAPPPALRGDVGCLYFATLAAAGHAAARGSLLELDIVPLQRKRFRLGAADAAARAWLVPVFEAAGCRLGLIQRAGLPASWSVQWAARR